MQEYMSEVEADAHEKDQKLTQLNEALTRERVQANLAGQQVHQAWYTRLVVGAVKQAVLGVVACRVVPVWSEGSVFSENLCGCNR